MSKKRTRKQKKKASHQLVNSQFAISFDPGSIKIKSAKKIENKEKILYSGSVRTDIKRSLIVSFLCLLALVVLYWFS